MRPHNRQSSRENATPSSGTSPLAFYKKVPPPRPKNRGIALTQLYKYEQLQHAE